MMGKRSREEITLHRKRRRSKTAVDLQFPMYLVKVSDFINFGLSDIKPHQDLHDLGLLVEWSDKLKGPIAVISHQWTGWEHPGRSSVRRKKEEAREKYEAYELVLGSAGA